MITSFDEYVGPAAGVATAMLWTLTTVFFTEAGRRIGPTFVNAFRILLAIVLHAVTYRFLAGSWLPDAIPGQVLYLACSGVIGLAVGDQALFVAFLDVGPRLSTLLMSMSPLFAVFFGWIVHLFM